LSFSLLPESAIQPNFSAVESPRALDVTGRNSTPWSVSHCPRAVRFLADGFGSDQLTCSQFQQYYEQVIHEWFLLTN
jgi:hypothetical protein